MIIIGYPGIGKSTFARRERGFVDLESSLFYRGGSRLDVWYIYYCKIAESLSEQGYVVFVSSHKQVVNYLKYSDERAIIICPDITLKEQWISKLRERYIKDPTDKNIRAWKSASNYYDENFNDLIKSGLPVVIIKSIKYNLETLFRDRIDKNKSNDFHVRQIWSGEMEDWE